VLYEQHVYKLGGKHRSIGNMQDRDAYQLQMYVKRFFKMIPGISFHGLNMAVHGSHIN